MVVDWTYTICKHMMKEKRLTDFKLPYVVLISKFIKHFGVDVEGELEESTGLLNGVSAFNMHKMGFTKIGNTWIIENDVTANVGVGAHDHKVGTSGMHQIEEEAAEFNPMAIELYNSLCNIPIRYYLFKIKKIRNEYQMSNLLLIPTRKTSIKRNPIVKDQSKL